MIKMIREYRDKDLKKISKIIKNNYYHINIIKYITILLKLKSFSRQIEKDIKSMDKFFIIEKEGNVLGCIGLKQVTYGNLKVIELRKLHIKWKNQKNGYGKLLLNFIIDISKEYNYNYLYAQVIDYEPSRKWFKKFGFEQVDEPWFNGRNIVVRYPLRNVK